MFRIKHFVTKDFYLLKLYYLRLMDFNGVNKMKTEPMQLVLRTNK